MPPTKSTTTKPDHESSGGESRQPQTEQTDRVGPGGAAVTDQTRGDDVVQPHHVVGAAHGQETVDNGDRLDGYQPNPQADPGTPARAIGDAKPIGLGGGGQ